MSKKLNKRQSKKLNKISADKVGMSVNDLYYVFSFNFLKEEKFFSDSPFDHPSSFKSMSIGNQIHYMINFMMENNIENY